MKWYPLGAKATFRGTAGAVNVSGTISSVRGLDFQTSGYTLNNGVIVLTRGHTIDGWGATINSTLAGSEGLHSVGRGQVNLAGSNTYSGQTVVNNGILCAMGNNALGSTSEVLISNGGCLQLENATSGVTITGKPLSLTGDGPYELIGHSPPEGRGALASWSGNNAWTGPVSVPSNSTIFVNEGALWLTGVVNGNGTITKAGAGPLYLTGSNTYSGGTNVINGYVCAMNNGALGYGSAVSVAGDGCLQLESASGVTIAGKTLNLNGTGPGGTRGALGSWVGSNTWVGPVTLQSDSMIFVNQGFLRLNGTVGGDGGLAKTGIGPLYLSGSNTYTGATRVSGGFLVLESNNALGSTSGVSVSSYGGCLQLESASGVTISGKAVSIAGAGPGGTRGALASWRGNNTWDGPVSVPTDASIFVLDWGSLTISGVISDYIDRTSDGRILLYSGPLRKIGNGTVNLTGVNKHSSTVYVTEGTLRLTGAGSINSANGIILNGGKLLQNSSTALNRYITFTSGTFGGTGIYSGSLSPRSCHLAPGDGGVGTLYVGGNVSLIGDSILDFDFGTTVGSNDRIAVFGSGRTLVLDGTINIAASTLVNGQYTIFSGFSSVTDNGLVLGNVPPGHSYSYSISGGSVIVTVGP